MEMVKKRITISSCPQDDAQLSQILGKVVVLLVTVNDKEYHAVLAYLKPLDGYSEIYRYHDRKSHGNHFSEAAIYCIGNYGACPAAVRQIKPGSSLQGGASSVPTLAYNCFKNLGAIIGVGVACGVEKKTDMCDVLVSDKVTNYAKARIQGSGELQRGETIQTSSYLVELFNHFKIEFPSQDLHIRLKNSGIRPKVKVGEILSGPYLIDNAAVKAEKIDTFAPEAIGIEMEAGYLVEGTQQSQINTIMVKGVCDFGDGNKTKEFQPTAALLAADYVHTCLNDPSVCTTLRKN